MKNNFDIYISSLPFDNLKDAVAFCSENSVNLEITKFVTPELFDNLTDKDIHQLNDLLKFNGNIKTCLHGMFINLVPASLDPKIVEISKQRFIQSIELARKLHCQKVVFHSGYKYTTKWGNYKEEFIEKQVYYWKNLFDSIDLGELEITLENTSEEDPAIISNIVQSVNHPQFKICLDTGHVNFGSKLNIIEYAKQLEQNLSHLHLHNNYGNDDTHNSLVDGTINFEDFLKYLTALNKPLTLVLELFELKALKESLLFLQQQNIK